MYTRSYPSENESVIIPENYDGNAFSEDFKESAPNQTYKEETPKKLRAPWDVPPEKESETVMAPTKNKCREKKSNSFFDFLPFGNFFGKTELFNGNFFETLGTEEILLIGIALFLLFTKNGDTECAVMLLFLLLIK